MPKIGIKIGVRKSGAFSWSRWWARHLLQTNLNFWVKEGTRNGLTLPDSISGNDATILPAYTDTFAVGPTVDLGTTYNPTASCFTVYARLAWDSSSSWGAIFNSASTTYVGPLFMVRQTTGILSTYVGAYKDSSFALVQGIWADVMFRYTTGVAGKIEIAKDGSAFETVYTGNLQTDLITGDGHLVLLNNTAHVRAYRGGISEIKFWSSSKGWDDYIDEADKHWLFTGQQFIPDISLSPLNGIMTCVGVWTIKYSTNGSQQSLDHGYSLWQKTDSIDIHIPHKSDGTAYSITAGVEIPAGYTLTKDVDGNLLNHNLADSEIQFIGSEWDRSDATQLRDAARATVWPYYYDATDANTKKRWHISELNHSVMFEWYNQGYSGLAFFKVKNNSIDDRLYLSDLFSYSINQTLANLDKIVQYISAHGYYVEYYFSDTHILATYGHKILTFDGTDTLALSLDDGATYPYTLTIVGLDSYIGKGYIYDNGNISFYTMTKAYYSEDNLATYHEATVLDIDGNLFAPTDINSFFQLNSCQRIYINSINTDIWGCYTTGGANANVWLSQGGQVVKSIYKKPLWGSHFHAVMFNTVDQTLWLHTGDGVTGCNWIQGVLDAENLTFAFTIIKQGGNSDYSKGIGFVFKDGYYYWGSDCTGDDAKKGIWRVLAANVTNEGSYEKVYDCGTRVIYSISSGNFKDEFLWGEYFTLGYLGVFKNDRYILHTLIGGVIKWGFIDIYPKNSLGYYRMDIMARDGSEATMDDVWKGQVLMLRVAGNRI